MCRVYSTPVYRIFHTHTHTQSLPQPMRTHAHTDTDTEHAAPRSPTPTKPIANQLMHRGNKILSVSVRKTTSTNLFVHSFVLCCGMGWTGKDVIGVHRVPCVRVHRLNWNTIYHFRISYSARDNYSRCLAVRPHAIDYIPEPDAVAHVNIASICSDSINCK